MAWFSLHGIRRRCDLQHNSANTPGLDIHFLLDVQFTTTHVFEHSQKFINSPTNSKIDLLSRYQCTALCGRRAGLTH